MQSCEHLMQSLQAFTQKVIVLERGSDGLGFSKLVVMVVLTEIYPYMSRLSRKGVPQRRRTTPEGRPHCVRHDTQLEGLTHEKAVEILKKVSEVFNSLFYQLLN